VEVNKPDTTATRPVLVYDGDCAFCTRSVRFLERYVFRRPRIVPWQQTDLAPLGLTTEMCQTAVQWVDGEGSVSSGHRAVAHTLIHGGGIWKMIGRCIVLPGVGAISAVVYRWVADNRHRMPGGTAECVLPQTERVVRNGVGAVEPTD
jgi:predicted DCC family thiol-disulfide oxidoreductase YuxK